MANIRLATWNVNSIRIRLELLRKLVEQYHPDIICLQEVKAKPEDFPFDEVKSLGYPHIALYSQAGYNGVVILSKQAFCGECKHNWVGKEDARHISVFLPNNIELDNIYIPAGGDIPDPIANLSFAHKLTFMDDVAEYAGQNPAALCRNFKLSTGRSIFNCLLEIRIDFAYKLLENSDFSITQVAYESGFKNISHFNHKFKLMAGISPLEYRKTHQTKK